MYRVARQRSTFLKLLFQRLQVEKMMDVLPFGFHQLLQNMLPTRKLLWSLAIQSRGVRLLARHEGFWRRIEFPTKAQNVEHPVDLLGDFDKTSSVVTIEII